LSECYPSLQPSEITRSVIVEYLASLATSKLEECTKHHHLLYLRSLFNLSNREGWAPVPEKQLIYDEDIPRRPKTQPRFIPEDVLAQLNQHLDSLPSHYMRMVLVLQECGMRISELCTMSRDCLTQEVFMPMFTTRP
jgi:integrase